MTLAFPNPSRSYDATRRAVRFWGHDTAMERSFFVTEDALRHMSNNPLAAESELLAAFDRNRDLICSVAIKIYGRGPKGSYELNTLDF
jgi:hypothetical protein